MDKYLLLLSLCSVIALSSGHMPYQFSSGYEFIIGQPAEVFSCEQRQYGYYADVDNDCRVFHICLPIQDHLGNVSVKIPMLALN